MEGSALQVVLELDGLTKRYGSLTAVNDITLNIRERQLFGILGPNGAGKSTLMKMIAGLLKPDEGTVRIKQQGQTGQSKHIGLCPQELIIWDTLTIWEQLLFMASIHNVPKPSARSRANKLMESLGLTDKKHSRASSLSGGMKRRLNIMLALMHDPDILILDEPHAGLDPQSRVQVREFLKELSARKTVIVTTHDMDEAEKMADRVAIIDHGKVLAEDTPERLKNGLCACEFVEMDLTQPERLTTEVEQFLKRLCPDLTRHGITLRAESEQPYELARQLQGELLRHGLAVRDVKIRKATLEDVFISMTGRGLRE